MKRINLFIALLLAAAAAVPLHAEPKGTRTSSGIIIDTGDFIGGFNVTVGTSTAVLLSSSGFNAGHIWRLRTFQVTGTAFSVWMSSAPSTYGSGGGWYVLGSTTSYSTRSQAAIYGILDPAAGSGTAIIKGPFEYHNGEVPAR